ncbi:hypothetical protein [Flavobacterium sp. XS1P27]|uniref:hypothetical protein n=1 Tax=Flavobacterium sp. XS1P27 TaxID=3401724 RepID=UPI003AB00F31
MTLQEQITALEKGIETLNYFIQNADLENETSFDLIFGDDLTETEIEFIEELGNNFISFSALKDNDIVSQEELEQIVSDFSGELDNLKSN